MLIVGLKKLKNKNINIFYYKVANLPPFYFDIEYIFCTFAKEISKIKYLAQYLYNFKNINLKPY